MSPPAPRAPAPARSRWHHGYLIVLGVSLLAALAVGSVPVFLGQLPAPASFYLLATLAIVADTPPFTLLPPAGAAQRQWAAVVSGSVCFTFAISVNWNGIGSAALVQVVAVAVAAVAYRRPWWRTLFDLGRYGLAILVAGTVLVAAPEPVGIGNGLYATTLVVAAALVWFAVFHLLSTVEEWLRTDGAWWWVLRHHLGEESLSAAAMLVLGLLVVGMVRADGWLLVLTLVPLYAVGRMVRLGYQRIRQALRDPVTGLANRAALAAEVDRQIRHHPETGTGHGPGARFALVMVDIDRLKYINEALGHEVGDRVLVAVAERLSRGVPVDDTAAHLGGDEFAVLITRVTGASDLRRRAAAVVTALSGPTDVNDVPLHVTCAAGVAVYPEHGADFATLLRHANSAIYEAKDRGLPVVLYQPGSRPDGLERLALLADLRDAVTDPATTGIELHYQPQVAMDTGEVVGVEALLRWRPPGRGPVSPDRVIEAAEQSDLMWPLTQRVIEQTLTQLARWHTAGLDVRASANISVRDLYQPEFSGWISTRLRESGVPAHRIQLEITETALMTQHDRVLPTLLQLSEQNIAISLDDFGTGYSSLARLGRLPIAEIKVDRSLITPLGRDPGDETIVRSIIELANRLGVRVVAEGVEDEAARDLLLASGCRIAQGWFYAAAMPPDDLNAWISAHGRRRDANHGPRSAGGDP